MCIHTSSTVHIDIKQCLNHELLHSYIHIIYNLNHIFGSGPALSRAVAIEGSCKSERRTEYEHRKNTLLLHKIIFIFQDPKKY